MPTMHSLYLYGRSGTGLTVVSRRQDARSYRVSVPADVTGRRSLTHSEPGSQADVSARFR